jgi:accessory gene regulator B
MLFKKLSTQWAEELCRTTGETDEYKIAIARTVFEGILSFFLSVSVLFIFAWIFGVVKEALLIGMSGAILKGFTGGLHLGTPLRCAIGGAMILVAVSFLSLIVPITSIPVVIVILILFAVNIIVWLKAPRESKGKPLGEKQKVILGILSKIIVLLVSLICLIWPKVWGINEVFYGVVFQVVNLLEFTARGMEQIDWLFGKIERKPIL